MKTRVHDLLDISRKAYPDKVAVSAVLNGELCELTFNDWYEAAYRCASYLVRLGLKKGDRVLLVTYNRPEWYIMDQACSLIGVLAVTIFPNYSQEDIGVVYNEVNPNVIVTADKLLLFLLNPILGQNGYKAPVITFDQCEGHVSFPKILEKISFPDAKVELKDTINKISEGDIYTIFYTSGTGGRPKGVALTHKAVVSAAKVVSSALDLKPDDSAISFLSLAHTYERGHYLAFLHAGVSVIIAEKMLDPVSNLKKYAPTVLVAVPLMLEKLQQYVIDQLGIDDNDPAYQTALKFEPFGDSYHQPQFMTEFKTWKELLSDHLRVIVSSGAQLPERIARFFWAIDIPVQEVYGSSECFCITYSIPPDGMLLGTAGPPADGVQIRLDDDGELLCKSPFMMLGILKDGEIDTAIVERDGFYRTGDLAERVAGRFIRIIGRKNDTIKLLNGYFICPSKIEGIIGLSKYINHSIVYADEGVLKAVIQVDPAVFELKDKMDTARMKENRIRKIAEEIVWKEINRLYNNNRKPAERIVETSIRFSDWTVSSGELTPTMKYKRDVILNRLD